jgi:hypothetical protein
VDWTAKAALVLEVLPVSLPPGPQAAKLRQRTMIATKGKFIHLDSTPRDCTLRGMSFAINQQSFNKITKLNRSAPSH